MILVTTSSFGMVANGYESNYNLLDGQTKRLFIHACLLACLPLPKMPAVNMSM
jgi:hypothetical protein